MKNFKYILCTLIFIISIILAGYIGIYLMLYGGIIQIINSINPINATGIAIGILKIIFCEIPVVIIYIAYYIIVKIL